MRLSHHVTAEIEECAHPGFGEGRVVVPELILPGTSFALGRSQHIQICLIRFPLSQTRRTDPIQPLVPGSTDVLLSKCQVLLSFRKSIHFPEHNDREQMFIALYLNPHAQTASCVYDRVLKRAWRASSRAVSPINRAGAGASCGSPGKPCAAHHCLAPEHPVHTPAC